MAHLFAGHIPMVSAGFCLLLFIFGMLLRSTRILRVGLFFISLTAIIAVWAYLSGPSAESAMLKVNPAAEAAISAHKESAATAFVVTLITGAIAFAGLLFRRADKVLPNWYTLMVTLLLIISLALLIGTAGMGFKISRPWMSPQTKFQKMIDTEDTALSPADSV
jgi:uncharacterized protein (DUF983 family)